MCHAQHMETTALATVNCIVMTTAKYHLGDAAQPGCYRSDTPRRRFKITSTRSRTANRALGLRLRDYQFLLEVGPAT